jgi:hypothetical protein
MLITFNAAQGITLKSAIIKIRKRGRHGDSPCLFYFWRDSGRLANNSSRKRNLPQNDTGFTLTIYEMRNLEEMRGALRHGSPLPDRSSGQKAQLERNRQ